MSAIIPAYFLRLPFVVDTWGVEADTLCPSYSVILSAGCGVQQEHDALTSIRRVVFCQVL
jgi:hypothetical protein